MPRPIHRRLLPLVACTALALLASGCGRDRNPSTVVDDIGAGTRQAGAADKVPTPGKGDHGDCGDLPGADQLRQWLRQLPAQAEVGGFAGARHEWAAVVDRAGRLCTVVAADDDPTVPWPGSKGIAIAKAFTANAFSSDTTPMSTARLYTMAQPGRSLYSASHGDPFNPKCLTAPADDVASGTVCGGVIVFGGGLALYRNNTKVGGLGLSGDTPCADHELAKRVRTAAKLDPPKGPTSDDITYSGTDGASIYTHPLCPNTWRNGQKIGEAPPASGY